MRELIPSHLIPADPAGMSPLPAAAVSMEITPMVQDVLDGTFTDALVVLHDGQVVAERYAAGMTEATPHLLMSVSKSVVSCVAAERDAEITCDPLGCAIHDGGISATARDLARFGQLLVDDGWSHGRAVVPQTWLADARWPEPGVREAFARTDNEFVLPGGFYRSQFWVIPGDGGPVLVCLGIHGQLIYADQATRTVVVKFSSWPDAQNAAYLLETLRACAAIAANLGGMGLCQKCPAICQKCPGVYWTCSSQCPTVLS